MSIIVPYQVMTIFLLIVQLCSLHEHEDPGEKERKREREKERKREEREREKERKSIDCQTTKSQLILKKTKATISSHLRLSHCSLLSSSKQRANIIFMSTH